MKNFDPRYEKVSPGSKLGLGIILPLETSSDKENMCPRNTEWWNRAATVAVTSEKCLALDLDPKDCT